ncbi:hypothetical protein GVAV_001479 [Gurleya vavrai]
MLLKPNQIVIVQNGRYTGKKAIILKAEETQITTAIITPKTRKAGMKINVRKMNPKHLIITRYSTDLNVEEIEDKKEQAKKVENVLSKMNEEGKCGWLFTKLKF